MSSRLSQISKFIKLKYDPWGRKLKRNEDENEEIEWSEDEDDYLVKPIKAKVQDNQTRSETYFKTHESHKIIPASDIRVLRHSYSGHPKLEQKYGLLPREKPKSLAIFQVERPYVPPHVLEGNTIFVLWCIWMHVQCCHSHPQPIY